jgi:hypothetical protein
VIPVVTVVVEPESELEVEPEPEVEVPFDCDEFVELDELGALPWKMKRDATTIKAIRTITQPKTTRRRRRTALRLFLEEVWIERLNGSIGWGLLRRSDKPRAFVSQAKRRARMMSSAAHPGHCNRKHDGLCSPLRFTRGYARYRRGEYRSSPRVWLR